MFQTPNHTEPLFGLHHEKIRFYWLSFKVRSKGDQIRPLVPLDDVLGNLN